MMKLATYYAANAGPPAALAAYYRQKSDGSWWLQTEDPVTATTADPSPDPSATPDPDVLPERTPDLGSRADENLAPQSGPDASPAVITGPAAQGGGAGVSPATMSTVLDPHDTTAINNNLAAIAAGHVQLATA